MDEWNVADNNGKKRKMISWSSLIKFLNTPRKNIQKAINIEIWVRVASFDS